MNSQRRLTWRWGEAPPHIPSHHKTAVTATEGQPRGGREPPTLGASQRRQRDSRQATHSAPGASPWCRMELSSLIGFGGTSKMKGMTSKQFGSTPRNSLEASDAADFEIGRPVYSVYKAGWAAGH
jgi:hypothetical protein